MQFIKHPVLLPSSICHAFLLLSAAVLLSGCGHNLAIDPPDESLLIQPEELSPEQSGALIETGPKMTAKEMKVAVDHWNSFVDQNKNDYFLGPKDILEIEVASIYSPGHVVTFKRTIGSDQSVTLPLIQRVKIGGMTEGAAVAKVDAAYRNGFINRPEVSVRVVEYNSKSVTFAGEVMRQGVEHLNANTVKLPEALGLVGGFSYDAGDNIFVTRNFRIQPRENESGESDKNSVAYVPRTLTIKKASIAEEGSPAHELLVTAGDVISVDSRRNAGHIYVLGYVRNQGVFTLRDQKVDAVQLLAEAGGIMPNANPEKCYIMRPNGDEPLYIALDIKKLTSGKADPVFLLANDTLVVGTSFLRRASEFVNPQAYIGVDGIVTP